MMLAVKISLDHRRDNAFDIIGELEELIEEAGLEDNIIIKGVSEVVYTLEEIGY